MEVYTVSRGMDFLSFFTLAFVVLFFLGVLVAIGNREKRPYILAFVLAFVPSNAIVVFLFRSLEKLAIECARNGYKECGLANPIDGAQGYIFLIVFIYMVHAGIFIAIYDWPLFKKLKIEKAIPWLWALGATSVLFMAGHMENIFSVYRFSMSPSVQLTFLSSFVLFVFCFRTYFRKKGRLVAGK